MRVHRELEDKFEVDENFSLPELSCLVPDGGREECATEYLTSDYFDTEQLDLLRAQITLRRRTGTRDNGWQLKTPAKKARAEIQIDRLSQGVPGELVQLLVGVSRRNDLQQIASLRTTRAVRRLHRDDGTLLIEVVHDTVSAELPDTSTVTEWREVEVEVGDASDEASAKLLKQAGRILRDHGARTATNTSKLARAMASAPSADHPHKRTDPVGAYLVKQQHAVLHGDTALRRGDDSVVHKTRVGIRRMRSTLRTFAPFYDDAQAAAIEGELKWWAGLLGEVRDRHVLMSRLHELVDELDDTLVLGPVLARIDAELGAQIAEHHAVIDEELNGERYLAMLQTIDEWVRRPPLTEAGKDSAALIPDLLRAVDRKVARRLGKANRTADAVRLHSTRKVAKRARYAAELADPVIGRKAARKQTKRYRRLQDLLGEHQDSQVSADVLRRLGAKAGTTPGENGFTFGILYQREQERASATRREARRTAAKYR